MSHDENIVRELFEKVFNHPPTLITQISDKGITNDVFIVEMSDQKLVLRISQEPNTSQFEKEKWEMEQAAQLGIPTPKVLNVGIYKNTVYMIEDYVDGIHGADDSLNKSHLWTELGKYAKTIHSIPVEGFGDHMSAPGRFGGNWDKYLDYNIASLNESDKLLSLNVLTRDQSEKIKILFENLKKEHFTLGLNHGDISLKNVVVDTNGKIVLLDWGSSESHIVPHFDIVEVLQSSFKFDYQNNDFQAFISGLGLSQEEFLTMKPTIDAIMLLRAIDHMRWAIDKKPEKIEHFKLLIEEILKYIDI